MCYLSNFWIDGEENYKFISTIISFIFRPKRSKSILVIGVQFVS